MKKLLFIPVLALTLSLTGCEDDKAKDYSSPELFFSHISEPHRYITIHSTEVERSFIDYNLTVKDEILKTCTFTAASQTESKSNRYITYYHLHSHSTAGPNYSKLYIYDDGYTRIEYKAALSRLYTYHFTCPVEQASYINGFVKSYLNELIDDEVAAQEKSKAEGTIENFFTFMSESKQKYVNCQHERTTIGFEDDGELLDVMKGITFNKTNDVLQEIPLLKYFKDYDESIVPSWTFYLYHDYEHAAVIYTFEHKRINYTFYNYYSLNIDDGHQIVDKALEIYNSNN